MPTIKSSEKKRLYDMQNDIRRNFPHMTKNEQDAWITSGQSLSEFLGSKRFIEKGWRMTKNG
jgi:hypothetical protein